ncbi:50S ribosomal protein L23 [Methanobrevibacter sp. DSM 116169]|uniref:50S ribosomal protein L23 n=1 Tax=Methanobrevibacter sp. DSM 116169 TaxID=3242727 RepID=UPI0038FCE8E8
MDPYSVIVKPHVTEKTMNLIDTNNELVFVINHKSNKNAVKKAFKELFGEDVERVNLHYNSKGLKIAYVKLAEESSAEDIAIKMGVF